MKERGGVYMLAIERRWKEGKEGREERGRRPGRKLEGEKVATKGGEGPRGRYICPEDGTAVELQLAVLVEEQGKGVGSGAVEKGEGE